MGSIGDTPYTNVSNTIKTGRFVMPVESARHSHTLLAYPSIASADDTAHLKAMQKEVINIANTVAKFEPVHLFARPDLVSEAKSRVEANVFVKEACADQLWIRDSGPVYTIDTANQQRTAISFNFNYWGSKLPPTGDENLAQRIAKQANEPFHKSRVCIEGGGIEIDGEGTFLGTESCIFNDNRNPGMTKAEIEAELMAMLGVTHFIWLPGVRGYDITDDHIDAVARFVAPGKVLLSKPASNVPDFILEEFEEARAILSKSVDAQGRSLEIIELEEPDRQKLGPADDANEICANYANYLLVNGGVVIPKFGQDTDSKALSLFKTLFPDRQVVQVSLNMLPRSGGGIHCATQQVPA